MLEAKVQEAWRVLRIQSELVDGTDKLLKLGAAVTVFGGARLDSSNRYYREAQLLGQVARRGKYSGYYRRRSGHYGGSQSRLLWHPYTLGRAKY